MDQRNNINMDDRNYLILKCEYKDIFLPENYDIAPIWTKDENYYYYGTYELRGFDLLLKDLSISSDREYPTINGINPDVFYTEKTYSTAEYEDVYLPLDFTGALIIGSDFIKDYGQNTHACYCYKHVKELIFLNGKLVTTINHNKAMQRIRKNIELGLRNPNKKKDSRCIDGFLKSTFVGNYEKKPKKKITEENKVGLLHLYKDKIKTILKK